MHGLGPETVVYDFNALEITKVSVITHHTWVWLWFTFIMKSLEIAKW